MVTRVNWRQCNTSDPGEIKNYSQYSAETACSKVPSAMADVHSVRLAILELPDEWVIYPEEERKEERREEEKLGLSTWFPVLTKLVGFGRHH